jgi:GNAT superfamily N-acetyltransferase
LVERDAANREYLEMVTGLLQQARLTDEEAGEWEAADLQWWWRRDQHADPANARFWIDDDGNAMGAVIFTDWGDTWGCDVIAPPNDLLPRSALWLHALERMERLPPRPIEPKPIEPKPIEIAVRDDDLLTAALLVDAGFARDDDSVMSCWVPAADRRSIAPIAAGYRLFSAAERPLNPHHMVGRNGDQVAERLGECSLYKPELDLYIVAPDDEVAAYGLFWADPVTLVGLVEPMRTEASHQHLGLGRHLLHTGLELLALHGCTRLKVSYYEGNDPARLLYLGAGFQPRARTGTYRRPGVSAR